MCTGKRTRSVSTPGDDPTLYIGKRIRRLSTTGEDNGDTNAAIMGEDKSPVLELSEELTHTLLAQLGRTFTTRELVQVKCVSKAWAASISSNSMITAKARAEDDTKDWYFPLRFQRLPGDKRPWMLWDLFTWSGLHHSSGEVHALPPLASFRPSQQKNPHHVVPSARDRLRFGKRSCLLASSGGLLLLAEDVSWDDDRRKSWRSLVVCNPLTKTWRMLPQAESADVGLSTWEFWAVQAHLVADESANSYQVILTLGSAWALCLYSSATNSWKLRASPAPFPWGGGALRGRAPFSPFTSVPSAILNGKLYYAELELDDYFRLKALAGDAEIRNRGHVSVFEVDYQAGTWKPPTRYALRDCFPDDLQDPGCDYGLGGMSFAMQIVECMGGLYAVIPAKLAVADGIVPAVELDLEDGLTEDNLREGPFRIFPNGEDGAMADDEVTAENGEDKMEGADPQLTLPRTDTLDAVRYWDDGQLDSEEEDVAWREIPWEVDEEGEYLEDSDDDSDDSESGRGYYCLPVQFYIVPLQGASAVGAAVGRLLTELPHARRSAQVQYRTSLMLDPSQPRPQHGAATGQGFRCSAKGSVIWVSWWDYMLQYDVVSGQSKAHILPEGILPQQTSPEQPNLAYRPNFHMRP